VQNLLKPPSILMRPMTMVKVWRGAREAERRRDITTRKPAIPARASRAA
jgi:hypothetical protein